MPYVLLAAAIVSEVFGTTCMKLSDGFKRKLPTVGLVVGYLIAFGCLGLALEHVPVGVAYGVWAGVGTALTAIVGVLLWKEEVGWRKVVGILLVIAGVVVLELGVNV